MENSDLLEMLLTESMNEELRNELLRSFFRSAGRETNGILRLNYCPSKLNTDEIYSRMKAVAGGTGASVARLLGVSSQALNNQLMRGDINGRTLIKFSLITKVSLDWLIGSRVGNYSDSEGGGNFSDANTNINPPLQQYLFLVETYDQQNGNVELKWCLTKQHLCLDDDNYPISGDFNALHSLIIRYRDEAGTPERVQNGGKRHYQVRRVLAYVVGDPKIVRQIDCQAKKQTADHKSGDIDRPGKTEFRLHSAKNECLSVFRGLVEQTNLTLITPKFDTIVWDFLIGTGSISPRDWILNKLKASKSMDMSGWVTTEESKVGWDDPNEFTLHTESFVASTPEFTAV